MKNLKEILNNGKLQILTFNEIPDINTIQIRAYYTHPITQKKYWCKFTSAYGWEHLTVSPQPQRHQTPDWDTMCRVKDIFWDEEECCIEYHPRKSQYVNNNETCLHIWRPINDAIPEPPTILLGVPELDSEQSSKVIQSFLQTMSEDEQLMLAEKMGIKTNRKMRRNK